jgi:hypothetical protein
MVGIKPLALFWAPSMRALQDGGRVGLPGSEIHSVTQYLEPN